MTDRAHVVPNEMASAWIEPLIDALFVVDVVGVLKGIILVVSVSMLVVSSLVRDWKAIFPVSRFFWHSNYILFGSCLYFTMASR